MLERTRPVHNGLIAAAEDVEYLLDRGRQFLDNHDYLRYTVNTKENHVALLTAYVDAGVRLQTRTS